MDKHLLFDGNLRDSLVVIVWSCYLSASFLAYSFIKSLLTLDLM